MHSSRCCALLYTGVTMDTRGVVVLIGWDNSKFLE
jgi:hypothetical protein